MTTSSNPIPRRRFLRLMALTPLAAGTSTYAQNRARLGESSYREPINRTGGPLLKLALNAYSFLELLNANLADSTKGIDLFGVCDFCAKHDIEAMGRKDYDPAAEVLKVLVSMREAISTFKGGLP